MRDKNAKSKEEAENANISQDPNDYSPSDIFGRRRTSRIHPIVCEQGGKSTDERRQFNDSNFPGETPPWKTALGNFQSSDKR
jgi:hypothetical protein